MKKQLLLKTLLMAVCLGGASSAWGDTSIGDTEKNWETAGSYSTPYTLAAGKTLTLNYTVTGTRGGVGDAHVLYIKKNNNAIAAGEVWNSEISYAFLRPDCQNITNGAWLGTGYIYNVNNFGSVDLGNSFFNGTTVQSIIRRYGTEIIVTTKVTKSTTTYTHTYVQDLGTTDDVYAYLCADYATIQLNSSVITDTDVSPENPVVMPIGALAKDLDFTNNAYKFASINANDQYNLHFKNYSGASAWENYTIRFSHPKDEDTRWYTYDFGDDYAWGDDDRYTKTIENWPVAGDVASKMNEADVTFSVVRSGDKVTIIAVNTPTSGDPFVKKLVLTLESSTEPIVFEIIPRNSRCDIYYPTDKVNAEVSQYGWATFSSPYKLDFSSVSGLQAYAVTGHSGTAITKSDALGVVAANAGVLLKGTEGTTSTFYNIPVSTGEAYDGTNLMVAGTGASVSAEEGKTKYVLGVSASEEAEFQKIVGTPATVAAGKAYLQFNEVISEARALRMSFGDETAVESVKAAAETAKKNGAYLENGKIAIYKNGVKFNVAGQQMK